MGNSCSCTHDQDSIPCRQRTGTENYAIEGPRPLRRDRKFNSSVLYGDSDATSEGESIESSERGIQIDPRGRDISRRHEEGCGDEGEDAGRGMVQSPTRGNLRELAGHGRGGTTRYMSRSDERRELAFGECRRRLDFSSPDQRDSESSMEIAASPSHHAILI